MRLQIFFRVSDKVYNFKGTKFREFRGFWDIPQNLIPAKRKYVMIREI